jgi:hypothetical protein
MRLICGKHKTRAAAIGCWHPEHDRFNNRGSGTAGRHSYRKGKRPARKQRAAVSGSW